MLKWILTVMLFTTEPSNIPDDQLKDHDLFEQKHVWSLQSTISIEFSSLAACWSAGEQFVDSIFPVGTMTLRYWCLCDGHGANCPDEKTQDNTLHSLLRQQRKYLEKKWEAEEVALKKDPKNREALRRFRLLRNARRNTIEVSLKRTEPDARAIAQFNAEPGAKASFSVRQLFPFPK